MFILLSLSLHSQITIERSQLNYGVGKVGEVNEIKESYIYKIIEEVLPGANMSWNMSDIETATAVQPVTNTGVASTDPYPDAELKDTNIYRIFAVFIGAMEYYNVTDESVSLMGFWLDSAYSNFGGQIEGAFLTVPAQKVDYKPEYKLMQFPITYNPDEPDVFNCMRSIKSMVTIPQMNYFDANVDYEIYYEREVKANGWGKVKIGAYGQEVNALMVSIKETAIDSIKLNGAPVSPMELALLGLAQGSKSTTETTIFYGEGYDSYLLKVMKYTNQQGTETYYGYVRHDLVTGVDDDPVMAASLQYPNPSNGDFNLSFDKTNDATWNLVFYNANGAVVKSFPIDDPRGRVSLSVAFGADSPAGVYFYKVANAEMKTVNTGKFTLIK